MPFSERVKARFSSKVEKSSDPLGCWTWAGAKNLQGYGEFFLFRKGSRSHHGLAHRVAWEMFRGPIGDMFVLHKCDTPACVNPEHLFLGTQKDNMRDALAKGRMRGLIPRGVSLNKRPAFTAISCDKCGSSFLKRNCYIRESKKHYCSRKCSNMRHSV